jgi:hypothetical protein
MANHFRLFAAARTVSLGQVLRMVDAEAETTFAPAIWWRLLHKSVIVAQQPMTRQRCAGACRAAAHDPIPRRRLRSWTLSSIVAASAPSTAAI